MSQPTQELEIYALSWPEKAKALSILDQATYEQAGELLKGIKDLRNQADQVFDPVISKANAAHKEAIAAKRKIETPLSEAEAILKRGIGAYQQAQVKIRADFERKAREDAERQADEIKLATAVDAESQGASKETCQQILDAPLSLPRPVIGPTYAKVSGISSRKSWKWRLVNASLVPDTYKKIDEVKIGGVVRALGPNCNIPGIEVYEESSIAVRTK